MIGSADLGLTEAAFSENQYSQTEKLFVRFHIHPKHNEQKSIKEGRPIFDDTEYIEIITPGDKDNIVNRPAKQGDKQRFAQQYLAFKAGNTSPITQGTPLRIWAPMTRSMVEELAFFKIFTVEQLAEVSDEICMRFRGLIGFKQQAKDFVAAAAQQAPMESMRRELEGRDAQIANLSDQLTKLNQKIDEMKAPPADPEAEE